MAHLIRQESGEESEGGEGGGEVFSGRTGLVLATIGAAVGTGNIWRFPREAAANGGGSFMIGWLVFLFLWSIPLIIAEYAMGKKTRLGTMGTMRDFAGKKNTWMGMWMIWVGCAVGFYYAVVMGWTIRYFKVCVTGEIGDISDVASAESMWDNFIESPARVVFFQFIAVGASAFVVYKGIKGIEKANKVLIPLLLFFLIITMIWPFVLNPSGAANGLRYLFIPQPEYLLRGETWIRALTQSAWSTSAGFGMALTYAVAMKKKEDVSLNAFLAGLGNNSVSLIAGVAVLATVFALSATTADGLEAVESSSNGLTFIYLTNLFASEGNLGMVIGAIFFLAMSFAALTSMIATVEIAARNFMDAGWERKEAVKWICLALLIGGIPAALSHQWFENQDFVWGTGLIISGLIVATAVMKFGVSEFRQKFINTKYSDLHIGKWWEYIIRYVFPVEFVIVFSYFMLEKVHEGEFFLLGTIVAQWALMLCFFLYINDRVAERIKKGPYSDTDNWDDPDDEDERIGQPPPGGGGGGGGGEDEPRDAETVNDDGPLDDGILDAIT